MFLTFVKKYANKDNKEKILIAYQANSLSRTNCYFIYNFRNV